LSSYLRDTPLGTPLPLRDVATISPPVRTLGIIGPSRAGKTTLKNRLAFQPRPAERTQSITAYIVSPPTTPPTYVALLDGGGEKLSQQFAIAEHSDHLCIVVDHNASDVDRTVQASRMAENAEFLKQVRHHLVECRAPRKKRVELLLNKRDLWDLSAPEEKQSFLAHGASEAQKWTDANLAERVEWYPHSNEIGDDIARFVGNLHEYPHA